MLMIADIFDHINAGDVVPMVATIGSYVVAIVALVAFAAVRISRAATKERSRREIAAYVAEGSMSPDEAERLLNAGGRACGRKS